MRVKRLYILSGAAVIAIAGTATFGYGLLVNSSLQQSDSAPKSKAATAVPTITSIYTAPSGAIYLSNTSGSDSNNGSSGAPVKTLAKAYSLVPSGGTIVIKGGTYRDARLSITKPITIQAANGEQVWFDGTDVVTGWQSSGATWYVDNWNTPEFCAGQYYDYAYNAQKTDNTGPCNHKDMAGDPSNPMAGSPQMVFVNDAPLAEVTSAAGVTTGKFYYDKTTKRMIIGTNPTGATVELARRPVALTLAAATNIKGIGFRKFATNEYNNNTEAAVIIAAANNVIENNVFWRNAAYGLGVSNATGAVVRSSQFLSNGFDGATGNGHHAGGATDNIVFDSNTFDSNNTEKFGTGCALSCAQAGVKLSHMNGGTIKNNKFTNNQGHGFWCDLYCTNFTIVGNYSSGNTSSGLMYEVSANAVIASNVVIGGEFGVRIAGPNIKFYNNTVLSPVRMGLWIYDDPRTPSGSEIPADTANVEVGNNIVQGGTDFLQNLQGNQTTAAQLESYSDYNAFYRPSGTPTVGFKYGSAAAGYTYKNTVALYSSATGKDAHSQDVINNTNPFFMNASSGDYRIRTDSVAYKSGKGLASDVATAIGVTAGAAVDRGAITWAGMPGGTVVVPPPAGDTTKPVTAIASPATNSSGKGTITISGSATDNVGITKVELLVDGAVKATDSTAPFATFSWDSTTVGDGIHALVFKAYDAAGNAATSASVSISITNITPPPTPIISSVSATPATIIAGQKSTLSWTTQYASSCDVTPGGTLGTTATSWQTPALTTVGTKIYTLTCYNTAVQSVSKTVSITVNAAPTPPTITSFSADKTTVQAGGSATFSWSSAGATSCVFNPGNIGGAAVVNGLVVSNITNTTTFTLVCQNNAGSTQATPVTISVTSTPVPVPLPVIVSFTADKSSLGNAQSTTLRWSTTGVIAAGCHINPGTDQEPNGSITTGTLLESTSYTLTCKNQDGKTTSASLSITVAGKPVPIAPVAVTSSIDPSVATSAQVTNQLTGVKVTNTSVNSQVSGLASLDISNVVNPEKEKAISYIEYYNGEQLIEKVSKAPFALNTKLLKNGGYSITERTYYIDGSQSEVTKVLGIENAAAVAGVEAKRMTVGKGLLIGLGGLLVALVATAVAIWFLVLRPRGYSFGYTLSKSLELGRAALPHHHTAPSPARYDPDANVQIISPTEKKDP